MVFGSSKTMRGALAAPQETVEHVWDLHAWNLHLLSHSDSSPSLMHRRDALYLRHCRMSYVTFGQLVRVLEPYVRHKNTRFRDAIPVRKAVFDALYRLAHRMAETQVSRCGVICSPGIEVACQPTVHVYPSTSTPATYLNCLVRTVRRCAST